MDLNARMTMGRLALGWRRLLPAGWCGTWLHLPGKRAGAQAELWKETRELARSYAGRARVLVTSFYRPRVAPLPRMSVLVLAQGTALRAQCEELLLRIAPG